jgi:response regulator of citrate/malate metabolism
LQKIRTWRTPILKVVDGILADRYSTAFARAYATFLVNMAAEIDAKVGRSPQREPNKLAAQSKTTRQTVQAIQQANPTWTTREVAKACGMSAATVSRYTNRLEPNGTLDTPTGGGR